MKRRRSAAITLSPAGDIILTVNAPGTEKITTFLFFHSSVESLTANDDQLLIRLVSKGVYLQLLTNTAGKLMNLISDTTSVSMPRERTRSSSSGV